MVLNKRRSRSYQEIAKFLCGTPSKHREHGNSNLYSQVAVTSNPTQQGCSACWAVFNSTLKVTRSCKPRAGTLAEGAGKMQRPLVVTPNLVIADRRPSQPCRSNALGGALKRVGQNQETKMPAVWRDSQSIWSTVLPDGCQVRPAATEPPLTRSLSALSSLEVLEVRVRAHPHPAHSIHRR